MSHFLTFINPLSALLAALASVPLLLLLYFLKLRRQEQLVASTLLWKKAIADLQVNAPFQRLRRNLLLLLQLLLLLLLCLALSRPVTNYKSGAGKLNVILIDRSGSMSAREPDYGGHTRLEEAQKRAKELIDTMRRDDTATVIAFDDSAETMCPFTGDPVRLKNAVDSIHPTDRRTKMKLAYELAQAQATFNEAQLRANGPLPDVFLYSDGRCEDASELVLHGQLHFDRIGTDNLGNVAIVALRAKRNYEKPTEVQVFARLANFGPEPVSADVQLMIDGKITNVAAGPQGTFLLPERWDDARRDVYLQAHPQQPMRDSIEFGHIDLPRAAVIHVEQMHKDGDALSADDAADVIVPPPRSLSVLLVSNGNYYLQKVIDVQGLKHPDTMTPIGYEDKKPTNYDVIIFDAYQPKWHPSAGNFVYFGIIPSGLKVTAVLHDGKPIIDDKITILDWKRDDPMLEHLSLDHLYVQQAIKMRVPPQDETLIEGIQGPLAAVERDPGVTSLVFGFDPLQSDWPLHPSFPIFFHNMLQFLAVGSDMDVRQSVEPGTTPKIPRSALQKAGGGVVTQVSIDGPMGHQVVKVPDAGDFVLPALNRVGVYTLDPPIPQYEKIAVNLLNANESNLIPVPEDKPPGAIGKDETQSLNGKARVELWWWIVVLGVVPLLMIEWWVYTRSYNRKSWMSGI